MQKHITISQISAIFTKDFDTFGKMDPFLSFQAGAYTKKTQIAQNGGKTPAWKAVIELKITQIKQIQLIAHDEDVTQNEFMGKININIASLQKSGEFKVELMGQDSKSIGSVNFKYQIKQIQKKKFPNQLIISEITGKFTKNFDTLGKMQPFITFKIGEQKEKTQVFDNLKDVKDEIKWKAVIDLGYNTQAQLIIKAYDQDVTQNQYIGMTVVDIKTLKTSGNHSVQLKGEDKQVVGTIDFKYNINSIKKEEPVKKPQPPKEQVKKSEPTKIQIKQIQNPTKSQKQIPKPKQEKKQFSSNIVQTKNITPVQQNKVNPQIKHEPIVNNKIQPVKLAPNIPSSHQISETKRITEPHNQSTIGNKSLNKSRQTLKLPNIGDIPKNFGDRIFDKQSSATLQKSILVYSMPKAPRFGSGPKYAGQPSYYIDTCFKPGSTKGVGFGFGIKKQFPQWLEKNMKQNPAPGAYFQDSKKSEIHSKGPTFGISHKYYEKVTIPKQVSPERKNMIKSSQRLKPIIRTK